MRLIPTLLAALALTSTPALASAPAAESVTLQVTLGHNLLPSITECAVDVATPTTAATVLDAAVGAGCIASWESASFPGFGRYVTCIDDVCEQTGTFWAFYVNEVFSEGGIDDTNGRATIHAGDVVEFAYRDWFTSLLA